MTDINSVLKRYRDWVQSHKETAPFRLECMLEGPATSGEIEAALPRGSVPRDLLEFWLACRTARLFEDVEYGQWGLRLLSPSNCARRTEVEFQRRPRDLRDQDLVIGEFLGDQELLLLAPSESAERRILVAMPLDERHTWRSPASTIDQFLSRYFDCEGDKYWE